MKNPLRFRIAFGFFFVALLVSMLLIAGALFFFSFPSVGIWFANL